MTKHIYIFGTVLLMMLIISSCKKGDGTSSDKALPSLDENYPEIKGDSMLYGLSCDGTGDSAIVIWPFKGDPITLSCLEAKENNKVIGHPEIGDWIGVMLDPEDSTEVTMVVDLDQLKATWTYPVMPVLKDIQQMSRRAQRRIMSHLEDTIKERYLIPREYGFTLKRSHNAQPVGRVMPATTLEDDSPVKYPEVKNYRKWYMLNGRLVLISGDRIPSSIKKKPKFQLDTLDFVSMIGDSLILTHHGIRFGFHRKENAMAANDVVQHKTPTRKK